MGILADQAFRLQRQDDWSAQELSEELYLIFRSKDPVVIDSPVVIKNNTGDPALTIANNGDSSGSKGDVFNITEPGIGSISFENAFPGISSPATTSVTTSGGGGIPGKVVSGSGANYKVTLYSDGVKAGATVDAIQLQIVSTETIPAGTWTILTKAGNNYVMQVPVWL